MARLCKYESTQPGTLLCVKPMGHKGDHDTPSYAETRRQRLYRVGARAEIRYQRRRAAIGTGITTRNTNSFLLREADALVSTLRTLRMAEPTF